MLNIDNYKKEDGSIDVDKLSTDLANAQTILTKAQSDVESLTKTNSELAEANKGFTSQVSELTTKASKVDEINASLETLKADYEATKTQLATANESLTKADANLLTLRRTYVAKAYNVDPEKIKDYTAAQLDVVETMATGKKVSSVGLDLGNSGNGGPGPADKTPLEHSKDYLAKLKEK